MPIPPTATAATTRPLMAMATAIRPAMAMITPQLRLSWFGVGLSLLPTMAATTAGMVSVAWAITAAITALGWRTTVAMASAAWATTAAVIGVKPILRRR